MNVKDICNENNLPQIGEPLYYLCISDEDSFAISAYKDKLEKILIDKDGVHLLDDDDMEITFDTTKSDVSLYDTVFHTKEDAEKYIEQLLKDIQLPYTEQTTLYRVTNHKRIPKVEEVTLIGLSFGEGGKTIRYDTSDLYSFHISIEEVKKMFSSFKQADDYRKKLVKENEKE